jgi:hypothetical protein
MFRPVPYTEIMIDPMDDPQVEHSARDMQVQTCDLRTAVRLVVPRLSDLRRYFGKSGPIIFLENRLSERQAKRTATISPFPRICCGPAFRGVSRCFSGFP